MSNFRSHITRSSPSDTRGGFLVRLTAAMPHAETVLCVRFAHERGDRSVRRARASRTYRRPRLVCGKYDLAALRMQTSAAFAVSSRQSAATEARARPGPTDKGLYGCICERHTGRALRERDFPRSFTKIHLGSLGLELSRARSRSEASVKSVASASPLSVRPALRLRAQGCRVCGRPLVYVVPG